MLADARNAGNAGTNTATQLRCLLLCHALAARCHGFVANNCLNILELMPRCLRSSNKGVCLEGLSGERAKSAPVLLLLHAYICTCAWRGVDCAR